MTKPLIIAHRGDSSGALENSLEAFRRALSLPVDMIEFDIRKSRDHALFVIHDEKTGRTGDPDIAIEKSLATDIEKVTLKNGEPVPKLTEVLSLVAGRVGLNIEVKSDGAGALTAALLAASGYRGDVLITSFKERETLDARRALPSVPTAGIFNAFTVTDVSAYAKTGSRVISLRKRTVTRKLVAALHDRSIKVYVWTVDDEADMLKFMGWGVDGIYSNKPALLKKVVDRLRRRPSLF